MSSAGKHQSRDDADLDSNWIVLSEDGSYCWFEAPRAIVSGSQLIVGAVASGTHDASRRGNIEAIVHDLDSNITRISVLRERLEPDDHDSPAFALLPDGRVLSMYAKHHADAVIYHRVSAPQDACAWGPERTFVPSPRSRVTYANIWMLPGEEHRIYDFYRGLDDLFKPSYAFSDDSGETWQSGGVFIEVPAAERHRPYFCSTSNGRDAVHFVLTEGHPRDFDNSLYHVFYRGGVLHRSDGTPIRSLARGLSSPAEATLIFAGDRNHVPWPMAIQLDGKGHPHVLYSVQVGSAGLPVGQGGDDIRYRMAWFDGVRWRDSQLAFAGSRLYAGEDDYSGLATFDPGDPFTLYLSANAHPATGKPLVSAADGQRHYELFRARSSDAGETFQFVPITRDSCVDYLRPLTSAAPDGRKILIALAGVYRSYVNYDLRVLAHVFRGSLEPGQSGLWLAAPVAGSGSI
jgi:hypothetical protein